MKAKLTKRQKMAGDIYSFWFKTDQNFRFIPGQYVDLIINGESRSFTISSPPEDNTLSITTILSSCNSNFKKTLSTLRLGEHVNIVGPLGDFILPKNPNIPLIFIAFGIGITPFNSIILDLKNHNQTRNIQLFYIASQKQNFIFADSFAHLGKDFHKKINRQNITKYILENSRHQSNAYFYIAGPDEAVDNLTKKLSNANINHIYSDYFSGYIHENV